MTKLAIFDLLLIVVSITNQGVNSVKNAPMTFPFSPEGIVEHYPQPAIVPFDVPDSAGDTRETRKTGLITQWDIEQETDRQVEETIDVSKSSQYIEGISKNTKLRIKFGDYLPNNAKLCVAFNEGTYGYYISMRLVLITDLKTYIKTLNGIFHRQTAVVLTRKQTGRKWTSLFQRFIPREEEETNPKHYTSVELLVELLSVGIFRVKFLLCEVNGNNVDKLSKKAEIKFYG